jgi:epsilon-lactone hydrolase
VGGISLEKTNVEQLLAIKGYLKQTSSFEEKSVVQIRREMAETAMKLPKLPDITVETTVIGNLRGEWVSAADLTLDSNEQAILYFHGGGFVAGTCEFYRDLAARISKSSRVKVY